MSTLGASTAAFHVAAPRSAVRQQVSALTQDVKSGNLSGAKSDMDALSQLLGGSGGSGSTASSSPFSAMLNQVGSALSTGNIAAAQSALADTSASSRFAQIQQQGQAADAAAGQKHRHSGGSSIGSLLSLQEDDSSDSSDATSSAAGTDMVSQMMASAGQSLANSDMTSMQQNLSDMTSKVGSAINATA